MMAEQAQELTAQDVWRMFQETKNMFQETDRKFQETKNMFQETDRKFQETDRKFQETDRKFQETDRVVQQTSREVAKTSRIIQELRREISDLTGSWGKFVESMVEPSLIRLFAARDIELDGTALNVKRRRNGAQIEIDVLAVDSAHVVVVEVKTTLKVDDVNEHLTRLAQFKTFFPEYQERRIVGAVAGMRIEQEADKYAARCGLFVLAQSGDTVELRNDAAFVPREW